MSEDFSFLDELLANINSESYVTKYPVNEDKVNVEPSKKQAIKSKLEEKFRKENAKLRSVCRHYRKTLNEREARLTELLKEKSSMTEEQGQIQECRKKLEEANLYIQATEQLNKQLHELSKSYECDKKVLSEKINKLQRKVKKLNKEINGTHQQKAQERKRRLKLLKANVELSEILISVGLLPVKHKRSLEGWKFELKRNEDELEDGNAEEKSDGEANAAEKSSSNVVVQVEASKTKEPTQAASGFSRDAAPLEVMSDSDSGDEGEKTITQPPRRQTHGAPIISSVKALYNRLITSTDEMLKAGSEFGSTVSSPCSSVSCGDQCGSGSCVGSEVSSGSQVFLPLTSVGSKSVTSDVGRTDKGADLFSEEDWHLDEFPQRSPNANASERSEKIQGSSAFKGSNGGLTVNAILKEMQVKLSPLLEPFEMDSAPCSPKNVTSMVHNNLPEKSVDIPALSESIGRTEDQGRNGITSVSHLENKLISNAISSLSSLMHKHGNGVKADVVSSTGNE